MHLVHVRNEELSSEGADGRGLVDMGSVIAVLDHRGPQKELKELVSYECVLGVVDSLPLAV